MFTLGVKTYVVIFQNKQIEVEAVAYSESQLDKSNTEWFEHNTACNSLKRLEIKNGHIRGITPSALTFDYPITAIVGENGSGKSTWLSLVACAFHNDTKYFPQNRKRKSAKRPRNYYTYGDFFTFSPDESGIAGVEIIAEYLSSSGIQKDVRRKKPSGKWNDFVRRPKRAVAYLGINRIVPPSESNPHRSYKRSFTDVTLTQEQTDQLRSSMSSILGKNYSDIELSSHSIYQLFKANRNGLHYSGFNMGTGENAVLCLLLEIINAGKGALIVVDEIELGLHVQAQINLVDELKKLCKKFQCQIICSTHSKSILEHLPPKARRFIKQTDSGISIIPEITPEYAFGKLSGGNSGEFDVFVEDTVGKAFLSSILPLSIRERINIFAIGSDQAILKHMAVHYREHKYNYISFMDGDKRNQTADAIKKISTELETRLDHDEDLFKEMMDERLKYLPGTTWPERVLVENAQHAEDFSYLLQEWGASLSDISMYLEQAITAGKHNEFYSLGQKLHLTPEIVRANIMHFYKQTNQSEIDAIIDSIYKLLLIAESV